MPLMVLKADLLRYAQVWVEGGIYADSDAECLQSLEDWLGEHTDAQSVVSVEWYKDLHDFAEARYHITRLVQWTFAATARHPMFINTTNEIVETVAKSPSHPSASSKTRITLKALRLPWFSRDIWRYS
ncbi:hypothetical protein BC830DRAFT_1106769 [Chytriomyces sp. MP71]|nr:hypothetical protein BC830DRAFT_1106769 [Chytriomyces sp. MP71]